MPGKPHGQRSLAGYSPRGGKELDMPEQPNNNNRKCWEEKPQGLVVERLDHLLHTGVRGWGGYGSRVTGRAVLGGPPGRTGTASKGGTQSAALPQIACWRNLYFNLAFLPHSDLTLVHVIVRYQYGSYGKKALWYAGSREEKVHNAAYQIVTQSFSFRIKNSVICKVTLCLISLASWCGEPTHWKRPWCCEKLKTGGEGGNRGWDGQMASLTQWTWVWANYWRQWRIGKPGVLQSMRSKRVRHDLVTEQRTSNISCN